MTLAMLKGYLDDQITEGNEHIQIVLTLIEAQALSNEISNLSPEGIDKTQGE